MNPPKNGGRIGKWAGRNCREESFPRGKNRRKVLGGIFNLAETGSFSRWENIFRGNMDRYGQTPTQAQSLDKMQQLCFLTHQIF